MKKNYREEINFVDYESKQDRKKDPAIDYSYENKGSIFSKYMKSMSEKKIKEKGHLEKRKNYNKNTQYNIKENYDKNYKETIDENEVHRNNTNNTNIDNNLDKLNPIRDWVVKNTGLNPDEAIDAIKKEYDNIKESINESNQNNKNMNKKLLQNMNEKYSNSKNSRNNNYKNYKKDKKENKSVFSKIFKVIAIIISINIVINIVAAITSLIFFDRQDEDSNNVSEKVEYEEPYIDYSEYKKVVPLKYLVPKEKVSKIEKEDIVVGKDIPAGEYIFVKNEGNFSSSIDIIRKEDKEKIFEPVNRNYYVTLYNGDNVKIKNGILYKSNEVELDMENDDNKKSGTYRLGKDLSETFVIEGNNRTYYSILDEKGKIIKNGFLKNKKVRIDKQVINEELDEGEVEKYIYINNGIVLTE
ncbi:hypothetical protein [Peptacetobacter sp.]|uniref:hypothetical protein n=1 Tax=Peptacetobacter sp. TaxID=2991975 RepID=UPI0026154B8F|nr:hypothetical protein [Peptacetobacter sp.]